jgi:hypothetical protein
LSYVQPSQKARRKNVKEFSESKISKLSNHVEDNVIKEGVGKQFQSFDLKLEKLVVDDDLSVMDEDLANKDTEDMKFFDSSLKNIMKDYLVFFLDTKVGVLKVIDDDEVKFEEKECVKELQVDFIGTKNYNIRLGVFFSMLISKIKI